VLSVVLPVETKRWIDRKASEYRTTPESFIALCLDRLSGSDEPIMPATSARGLQSLMTRP
jgi:hypothetical protein